MIRRPVMGLVGCCLLVWAVGCRHNNCGGSGGGMGLFSSGSQPPTRLASGSAGDACFSTTGGVPLTAFPAGGGPITYPGAGIPMTPGTIPGARPDELPFPNPSDMIPRPAVPIPAPGDPGNIGTLPAPVTPGQPVKGNK